MFQVVLSNKDHMEYGVVTVPFPIPEDQYTDITRMLEVLHVGSELSRDCMVESVESDWPVLRLLTGQEINLDELDYLAKRLDGISPYEKTQFQAAAEHYGLSRVTDLINLTFCCDQATVIVDFSDLEQVGRIHYLTLNGGATREEMESLDGYETALLLINEHPGIITPYGVFYDNGMQLEPVYDGRYFPQYLYADSVLTLALASDEDLKKGANVTWLYLPCSEERLERALTRAGITQRSDINLFVMDNNVVRILCILFLISKREERIRIHSLQLCVSLKSPLCIVPLIREGKEQPAGKSHNDAKQCNEQKALHRLKPFLNKVEIVDRIRSCGCHRKEHHSRNYQTNDSLHNLHLH